MAERLGLVVAMSEIVNLPELSKKLRKLSGWFQLNNSMEQKARLSSALVCMQAANEIDTRLAMPPNFSAAECTIHEHEDGVHLWYVQGVPGRWYPTKIVAEQVARITFPDEPNNAYGRVYYCTFLGEP